MALDIVEVINSFAIPYSLLLWTCSWIPLWKISDLQKHFFGARQGLFAPAVSLQLLLPGGVLFTVAFHLMKAHSYDTHERALLLTAIIVFLIHGLAFSVWQVPYCTGKQVLPTFLVLFIALITATTTAVLVVCTQFVVSGLLFFAWASCIGIHIVINLVVAIATSGEQDTGVLSFVEMLHKLGLVRQ